MLPSRVKLSGLPFFLNFGGLAIFLKHRFHALDKALNAH
jgi:hypothetical protein